MTLRELAAPVLQADFERLRQECDEEFDRVLGDLARRNLATSGIAIATLERVMKARIPAFGETFLATVERCGRMPAIAYTIPPETVLGEAEQLADEFVRREVESLRTKIEGFGRRSVHGFSTSWVHLDAAVVVRGVKAKLKLAVMEGGMFDQLLKDTITVKKADGRSWEAVKATVQGREVITMRIEIPFEPGDVVERVLPSGVIESMTVEDAAFTDAPIASMRHYTLKCRKSTDRERAPHSVHVSGINARVNINSTDNSINVLPGGDVRTLFGQIRQSVSASASTDNVDAAARVELNRIMEKLDALEQAVGTPGYLPRYQELMQLAANHVTVIAPFLGPLADMISRSPS